MGGGTEGGALGFGGGGGWGGGGIVFFFVCGGGVGLVGGVCWAGVGGVWFAVFVVVFFPFFVGGGWGVFFLGWWVAVGFFFFGSKLHAAGSPRVVFPGRAAGQRAGPGLGLSGIGPFSAMSSGDFVGVFLPFPEAHHRLWHSKSGWSPRPVCRQYGTKEGRCKDL